MPGFIPDLQHILCFRCYILYMDIAIRLERQFNYTINYIYRWYNRWYNFSSSIKLMRNKFHECTECICYCTSGPARYNIRLNFCMPGFVSDLQHIRRFRGDLLYMDIAIGMER
jgi:hypothetical protein